MCLKHKRNVSAVRKTGARITLHPRSLISESLCVCVLSWVISLRMWIDSLFHHLILCSSRLLVFSVLTWCYTCKESTPLPHLKLILGRLSAFLYSPCMLMHFSFCLYKLLYSVPSAVSFQLSSTFVLAAWCKDEGAYEERQPFMMFPLIPSGTLHNFIYSCS